VTLLSKVGYLVFDTQNFVLYLIAKSKESNSILDVLHFYLNIYGNMPDTLLLASEVHFTRVEEHTHIKARDPLDEKLWTMRLVSSYVEHSCNRLEFMTLNVLYVSSLFKRSIA